MSTVPETPVTRPYKHLFPSLKAAVKRDTEYIREAKPRLRTMQQEQHAMADAEQASLAKSRFLARTRLLFYGLARGHEWGRMESNRPDGDESLKHAITKLWLAAKAESEEAGFPIDPPALLQPWLLK